MDEKILLALKKQYDEWKNMLDWHGYDGTEARIVCGTIENILTDLGYKLDEIEWLVRS